MIVFDAGALVALDRGDRTMWSELKQARAARTTVIVPAGALAQAWRGGPRSARLALALHGTDHASFDEVALAAGELCGKAATGDVIDASVAIVAADQGVTHLYTSDPDDLSGLLRHAGRRRGPKIVPC